ncbi:MAG: hypothetical protein K6A32_06355, partial [Bacteroidales bacterium]|nr:hypothetical protein [Bacteroidales bacterium]
DVTFTMEITRLIERCRQGDADALGELYKAYAQRMRGVCRRYISDEQTVEDVLHDAFVIIFTSFDKLRDGHSSILTDIVAIKQTYEVLMRIKRLFTESS